MLLMVLVVALAGALLAMMLYTAARPRVDVSLRDDDDRRIQRGHMRW